MIKISSSSTIYNTSLYIALTPPPPLNPQPNPVWTTTNQAETYSGTCIKAMIMKIKINRKFKYTEVYCYST